MSPDDKPLVWLDGELRTPPFSPEARVEAGYRLRLLQKGESLSMPHSRPMPTIGKRCYELRIKDKKATWRIVYRIDDDAILILEIFDKNTNKTPKHVIDVCRKRMKQYDRDAK
jgi:phage-related protein